MNIDDIPFITVSYNAPDLIENLIKSTRQFYPNKIYVIDGSDRDKSESVKSITEQYNNTEFHGFNYNIHHGPGMAWAINNLNLTGPVLFIDSDMRILERGFLEKLYDSLTADLYGVGNVIYINDDGFTIDKNSNPNAVAYLHPALMLCNAEQMRHWPMPIKHGAPMTETMLGIHRAAMSGQLLHHQDWVFDVIENTHEIPRLVKHEGRGTVLRSGSYNLNEWMAEVIEKNKNNIPIEGNTKTTALDLGCGNHPRNIFNAKMLYGIDAGPHLDSNVIKLDIITQKIPFADNFFDGISAYDLIPYLPKIAHTPNLIYPILNIFDEVWRLLKQNGLFFLNILTSENISTTPDPLVCSHFTTMQIQELCSCEKFKHLGYSANFKIVQSFSDSDRHSFVLMKS